MPVTIVEILIDYSGSMGYMKGNPKYENKILIDGQPRINWIKKMLIDEIIPAIHYSTQIIIRKFRTGNEEANEVTNQIYTDKIYDGTYDKEKLIQTINSLDVPLPGGTPISQAIDQAVSDLKKFYNCDRKIILLTDGEENAGGDFEKSAKNALELEGIPCKIFIVGIAQDEEAEKKSRQIATGLYVNLKSSSDITGKVKNSLGFIKEGILKDSLKNTKSEGKSNLDDSKNESILEEFKNIKSENRKNTLNKLESLEEKILKSIQDNQRLFSEISSVREMLLLQNLLESDIDSTTLTIDEEYSEEIKKASERFLYEYLCSTYGEKKVRWLNENQESGKPYDFELLNSSSEVINQIECKGTPREKMTFYLTKNEWEFFLDNKETYQLYRVFNTEGEMHIKFFQNLFNSIIKKELGPYLSKPEILKENRVFLTIN